MIFMQQSQSDKQRFLAYNVVKTIINHPPNHHKWVLYGFINHQTCGGLLLFNHISHFWSSIFVAIFFTTKSQVPNWPWTRFPHCHASPGPKQAKWRSLKPPLRQPIPKQFHGICVWVVYLKNPDWAINSPTLNIFPLAFGGFGGWFSRFQTPDIIYK